MRKIMTMLALLLGAVNTQAAVYVVWDTKIQVYVQSETSTGTAHMIQAQNGIYNNGNHPSCGKRAYIDFNDKGLLSAALAASMSQQKVNFMYEDGAVQKVVQGHTNNHCKVISIFSSF